MENGKELDCNKAIQNRKTIVLIDGHAGDLDWIIPVIKYLIDKNLYIEIVYLTKAAKVSVKNNFFLSDYLDRYPQIKCFEVGWVLRKIRDINFILHRIRLKTKNKILDYCLNIICNTLTIIYVRIAIVRDNADKENLIFSGHIELKKSRNFRPNLERVFQNSIFFYYPNTSGIYTSKLEADCINNKVRHKCRSYAMFGSPCDFEVLKKSVNHDVEGVVPMYTGHPKYSDKWISSFKKNSYVSSMEDRKKKVKILIISRIPGAYLDKEVCESLANTTMKVVHEKFSNYQVIVKKHPREFNSYWSTLAEQYPSIVFSEDSVSQAANKVDFSIAFFSTASMDCFIMGTPVIEFLNPKDLKIVDTYTNHKIGTQARALKVVLPANNESELRIAIDKIVSKSYKASLESSHLLFQNVVKQSNQWDVDFNFYLNANNIYLE
jgi:hypothetical protein